MILIKLLAAFRILLNVTYFIALSPLQIDERFSFSSCLRFQFRALKGYNFFSQLLKFQVRFWPTEEDCEKVPPKLWNFAIISLMLSPMDTFNGGKIEKKGAKKLPKTILGEAAHQIKRREIQLKKIKNFSVSLCRSLGQAAAKSGLFQKINFIRLHLVVVYSLSLIHPQQFFSTASSLV